jgi:ABC-2 type transport system permease protein
VTTLQDPPVAQDPAVTLPRAPWTLVLVREVQVRLRDRTFIVSTLLTLFLLLASMVAPAFFSGGDTEYRVAVADDAAAAVVTAADGVVAQRPTMTGEGETRVLPERVGDRAAAEASVLDGDADVALVGGPGAWEVLSDGEPDTALLGALTDTVTSQALAANAQEAGTSVEALLEGTAVSTVDLAEAPEQAVPEGMLFLLGFGFAMVFYFAALMFGMQIAASVVEEKQSRIVEILAAAIPVRDLLIGKVLGNTLLALGQMALIVVTLLVGLTFVDLDVSLPGLGLAIAWYLPFFLLGFLALACVWAAAGALASRTEDLQATTLPLTMVLVAFLLLGINLEGVWRTVASFVPIMSTILMPVRVLEGGVPWWEPALALVLVALFSYLTVHLGSRLYRRALLHTSGSLSWRRAMTLED